MIVIIDYGLGNIGSILNMLKKNGAKAVASNEIDTIKKAEKLILPGVGAFDNGIKNLRDSGLLDILNEKVLEKNTPILGICLGMQILTKESEEGKLAGLNYIDAVTIKFNFDNNSNLKVPHMGWNTVDVINENDLFKDMPEQKRFYFVHSYYVKCNSSDNIITTTNHGVDFVSSFQKNNIFGVQFHPEKSHKFGLRLLKNFAELI